MLVGHIVIITVGHMIINRKFLNLMSGTGKILLERRLIAMFLSLYLHAGVRNAADQILHLGDLCLLLIFVILERITSLRK